MKTKKNFKREEKKKEVKKDIAVKEVKKETLKFTRVKDAPSECKLVKVAKDKHLFLNPYTGNKNKFDMIAIHKNMGKNPDSMMHYVAESISKKMKEVDLLKGLEKFVNPEAKTDDKPSKLLSKSRYRLKHDGRPTMWNETGEFWEFMKELPVAKK